MARHRGFEPLTYGSGVRSPPLGGSSSGSQVVGNVRRPGRGGVQGAQRLAGVRKSFAASLLHGSGWLRVVDGWRDRLLTVRQVAERLGVSTATVYALVARGELVHVRVSNSIRVGPADVAMFIAARTNAGTERQ
jgi:excisionase family DNA binding protein